MEPAIRQGELVVLIRKYGKLRKGGIVNWLEPMHSINTLRRIAGVGGDKIVYSGTHVEIENKKYKLNKNAPFWGQKPDGALIIPSGYLFLISESQNGLDSRQFGFVDEKTISWVHVRSCK